MGQLKIFTGVVRARQTTLHFWKTSNVLVDKQQLSTTFKTREFSVSSSHLNADIAPAKSIKECPTAKPWEMIRGFLPGGKFYKKDINEFISLMQEEKGNIIFMPGALGKPDMIVTHNPDDFEKVFRHEGVWPTREGNEILAYHRMKSRGSYDGLVTAQGKAWGDFRSAVNPIIMHPKNVKVYLPIMSKVNEEFIERIKAIRDPQTLEVPDNFKDDISRWTLESVSVVALDKQLGLINGQNAEAKVFCNDLNQFFELTADLEIKPSTWRYLPNRKFKRVMAILDNTTAFTEKHINEAIERIENSPVEKPDDEQSVLEKLLKVDKNVAIIMAMDMMFAGVDTTASTFSALLLCLAKNPDKQQKLREEFLQILPSKNSPLTVENMKTLPYLRACMKESQRIYPLLSGNLRTTGEDLVLSGYHIPKGTQVAMASLKLFNDPKHYSSPSEFVPERWLRQQPAKGKADAEEKCPRVAAGKSSHPFVFLPFGFGSRSCIGRRIAEMEMEIGIARILRNFEVEFNYSTENAFKASLISVPVIPLKFKFTDINY